MKTEVIHQKGYEKVVKFRDIGSGLISYIAVHNTALGPALGGCRMWPYASHEEALADVLRLSKGMTQKNALAGLNLGGGKAVIIGNSSTGKSPALFKAFGRAVESLKGLYYTAEDVGVSAEDMRHVARETKNVAGLPEDMGGSGDPSPFTAYGVFLGLKAAANQRFGTDDLQGVKIIVTGLGHVGFELCRLLSKAGAKLIVADIDVTKVRRVQDLFGAGEAHPVEAFAKTADIFAPCALGGALNDATIPMLQVGAIAGAANNQLKDAGCGDALHKRGILYAPDYVINAGGVISIAEEISGAWDKKKALAQCGRIRRTLEAIFDRSAVLNQATNRIADRLAAERLNQGQIPRNAQDIFEGVA